MLSILKALRCGPHLIRRASHQLGQGLTGEVGEVDLLKLRRSGTGFLGWERCAQPTDEFIIRQDPACYPSRHCASTRSRGAANSEYQNVCQYTCQLHAHVCKYVNVYVYIYIYIYMKTDIYIYIYIYIYRQMYVHKEEVCVTIAEMWSAA